eukprot:719540-Amphidinium_carterae.1
MSSSICHACKARDIDGLGFWGGMVISTCMRPWQQAFSKPAANGGLISYLVLRQLQQQLQHAAKIALRYFPFET